MKRAIFVLLLLCGTVFATVYNKLSLEQQTEKADVIVHAVIKNVRVEDRGSTPWTLYALAPKREAIKGQLNELPRVDNGPGFAIVGGRNLRMEGAPSFKTGDEVILLLYTKPFDCPIVGLNQGAYRIVDGRVQTPTGKPILVTVDGKNVELGLAEFTKKLETLAGGGK